MLTKLGKFITLEGGEGAGKTSNIAFIQNYLTGQSIDLITTREPGGTLIAERIRQILLTCDEERLTDQAELLLVFAARAQHLEKVISPALAQGKWVICDRFTDATYAYQGGGRGLDKKSIAWLENFVQADLRPDLTLLLDTPVETGLSRVRHRGVEPDRFETERLTFFTKVRESYIEQAQLHAGRIKVIDAQGSLDEVQGEIVKALDELLTCR